MRVYRNFAAAGAVSGAGLVAAVVVASAINIEVLAWVINVWRRQ